MYHEDSVAQWIRRWSTEPEILGSIPSGVVSFFLVFLPRCIFSILAYQAKILQLDWSTSGKGKGFITLHQTMQNRNSATLFETLSE